MVEDVSFACAAAPPGFKSIPKAIVSSHSRRQSKNSGVAAERKGNGIFDSRTHISLSHALRCGGRGETTRSIENQSVAFWLEKMQPRRNLRRRVQAGEIAQVVSDLLRRSYGGAGGDRTRDLLTASR